MTRVFFVSIKPSLNVSERLPFDAIYGQFGQNTGNLLSTKAIWSQIQYEHVDSGFFFDPDKVNAEFDSVVIPAANWLQDGVDLGELGGLVEQLNIPVTMIGVGAQAASEKRLPRIPRGTLRLMNAVSDKSELIGVRGQFTAETLGRYGIQNTRVIGCPSMYFRSAQSQEIKKRTLSRILLAGTRFYLPALDATNSDKLQQEIYQFALRNNVDILFQSERPELDYLLRGMSDQAEPLDTRPCAEYYGVERASDLETFLDNHGKAFVDVDEWLLGMADYDFYLGARVNGVIASLAVGTPACLITHDSRTTEIGEFAGIPSIPIGAVMNLSMKSIEEIYEVLDFSEYARRLVLNKENYLDFLSVNQLPAKL